jgi:geranylgeranyl reductase family protein
MKIWDAIIVGAGPAGCAAAYDLAATGREVLLLDRATFPRQKACAGGLTLKTVEALRYSVEPVVRQKISHMRLERDADRSTVLRRRPPFCYMTVRKELDDYCLRQTMGVGAQFSQIRAIETISEDNSGVMLRVDGETLRARFLVGADGVHSRVRRLTEKGEGWFWRGFALEAMVPVPDAAAQELIFDFAPVGDGYGWVFPKGDHLNVGLYSYSPWERIDRSRLENYIRSRCGNAVDAEVIGQYAGFGAARHTIAATRVFLAGDAGGFVDPLTGEGIYFAVASGQAAAEAIGAGLSQRTPAHDVFSQATAKLRADLAMTTSAARWFYSNLDKAHRILSIGLLHSTILKSFANGFNPAKLAGRVRKLAVKN